MAAEQGRARGKASAATATRVQNALIDGSLCGILERLDEDPAFHRLVSGGMSIADGKDIAPIITVGTPDGLRPAIAAAQAEHTPVVLVVASSREAEDTVNALRSWYDGDPNDIAQLEAWETLPHERLSPRADTVASRMAVFRRLTHPSDTNPMFGPIRILVMPVRSLIQPVVKGLGDVDPLVFTQGEELPLDDVSRRLVENAYTRVDLVMDRGEFAVRGGIIDVFPPTAPHPVRIEFFGDEIDSIREFHASDQRTYGEGVRTIWATPCRELQLTDAVRDRAKRLIGQIPNADDMLESIANAIPIEGMESLMPAPELPSASTRPASSTTRKPSTRSHTPATTCGTSPVSAWTPAARTTCSSPPATRANTAVTRRRPRPASRGSSTQGTRSPSPRPRRARSHD